MTASTTVNILRPAAAGLWAGRVAAADWDVVAGEIDEFGGALLPQLLTPDEAGQIRDLYE